MEPKGRSFTELHQGGMMDTGTHRVSIIPSHAWQSGNPATCLDIRSWRKGGCMVRSILAIWLGERGNCLGRDRSGCWIGPKCTTWQNKTLAYTGIMWQEVFVCGPETKQYFLNETNDGYARCAVCISPVLREVEGVLWPLKARTHPCRSVARRLPISHSPIHSAPPPPR